MHPGIVLVMTITKYVAFLALPAALIAQQDTGAITGVITDQSSATIASARITVANQATNERRFTQTGSEGAYTVGSLRVGVYTLLVEKPGFASAEWKDIEVHAGDRVRADVPLSVGQVTETVAVTAQSPLLQVENPSLGHVVEQREIRRLPLNGRNFQQLAWLTSGVAPNTRSRDRESGFNSHGQPAVQNSFLVDGVDNNTHVMGLQDLKLQVIVPSLDSVAEFKVQTSNYSAEYGRNSGAVMVVNIKSGSNQFHGSAYEYIRNDVFDSRDTFNYLDRDGDRRADPEILRQNQFGATFGGPIRRNRTFFFASWEGRREHRAQSDLAMVPTPAERRGVFDPRLRAVRDPLTSMPFPGNAVPQSLFDSTAGRLLEVWPQPNFSDANTRFNYIRNPPWTIDRDQIDTRVDHNLTNSDKLFLRFSLARFHEFRDAIFPQPARGDQDGFRNRGDNPARSVAFSYTRIFSPTILYEFRYGLSRQKALWQELSTEPLSDLTTRFGIRGIPGDNRLFGLPRFAFAGAVGYTGLGEPGSMPNFKLSQVHQYLNNLSWNRGNHSLRFGSDIRYNRSDADIGTNTHGVFTFDGQFTNISFADFLLGRTSQVSLSTWLTGQMRFRDYMFFAQDDWKITRRLTLNLGVRYELDTPWYDKHNNMGQLILSPGSNFGAIELAGERAGACGRSYSCRALSNLDTNNWAPRIGLAYQLTPRTVVRSGFGVYFGGQGALGANGRPIINFPFTRNVTGNSTPTRPAVQLSDGLPTNFLGSTTIAPAGLNWIVWARDFPLPTIYQWNLTIQSEVARNLSLTTAYVGSSSNFILGSYNWNGAPIGPPATEPQRRPIPLWNTISYYSPYAHSSFHGLDVQLERRYSSGFVFTASYGWSHSLDNVTEQFGAGGGGLQRFDDFRSARGNSNFDVRHRFVSSAVYELPFLKSNRILGGWEISGLLSTQTGHYFTLTVPNSRQRLGATAIGNWWPDRIRNGSLSSSTADLWFDTTAFVLPRDAAGNWRFGNAGRAILASDGPFNVDFGLLKSFRLTERFALQFRAEAFNLTNTPTLNDPNGNIESPDFGKVRATASFPRQFQFALRLSF